MLEPSILAFRSRGSPHPTTGPYQQCFARTVIGSRCLDAGLDCEDHPRLQRTDVWLDLLLLAHSDSLSRLLHGGRSLPALAFVHVLSLSVRCANLQKLPGDDFSLQAGSLQKIPIERDTVDGGYPTVPSHVPLSSCLAREQVSFRLTTISGQHPDSSHQQGGLLHN